MRKLLKKRIELRNGLYYPQYRGWFFWHNYHLTVMDGSYAHTFCTLLEADEFLVKAHASELKSINNASIRKIIEWNP